MLLFVEWIAHLHQYQCDVIHTTISDAIVVVVKHEWLHQCYELNLGLWRDQRCVCAKIWNEIWDAIQCYEMRNKNKSEMVIVTIRKPLSLCLLVFFIHCDCLLQRYSNKLRCISFFWVTDTRVTYWLYAPKSLLYICCEHTWPKAKEYKISLAFYTHTNSIIITVIMSNDDDNSDVTMYVYKRRRDLWLVLVTRFLIDHQF